MSKLTLPAEWLERNRKHRSIVQEFAEAVRTNDLTRYADAFKDVDLNGLLEEALRAIKGLSPSDEFRQHWLTLWVRNGDTIRSNVTNDLVLLDALRALLPRYTGRARKLYRGDSAYNRQRRTYGLSWSSSLEVARDFALDRTQYYFGGTVLLETMAPPAAIISASVMLDDDRYHVEQEFIVDRRKLRRVIVLERFGYDGAA